MERVSTQLNRILNGISAVLMLVVTAITVIDVSGRFFFNKPLPGTIEATELALVLISYLAFGYAEHHHEHIVIDAAYVLMPPGMKRVSDHAAGAISFFTILLMAWQMYAYAWRMAAGGYYTAVLGIPLTPVIVVGSLGSLCYATAILCNIIKSAAAERKANES